MAKQPKLTPEIVQAIESALAKGKVCEAKIENGKVVVIEIARKLAYTGQ